MKKPISFFPDSRETFLKSPFTVWGIFLVVLAVALTINQSIRLAQAQQTCINFLPTVGVQPIRLAELQTLGPHDVCFLGTVNLANKGQQSHEGCEILGAPGTSWTLDGFPSSSGPKVTECGGICLDWHLN